MSLLLNLMSLAVPDRSTFLASGGTVVLFDTGGHQGICSFAVVIDIRLGFLPRFSLF